MHLHRDDLLGEEMRVLCHQFKFTVYVYPQGLKSDRVYLHHFSALNCLILKNRIKVVCELPKLILFIQNFVFNGFRINILSVSVR